MPGPLCTGPGVVVFLGKTQGCGSCHGVARVLSGPPTLCLLTCACPHPHQRAGPVPSSSTASLLRRRLRCTTMSRRCLRVSCARYACAGTAKRPTHVGKRVLGGERALARRRSASWAASSLETAARWPCVPSPSPATTSPCSRPWGTHCIVQTDGQIGGLAQPTAQGAPGLAQTLGIPHLMVMDRETVLPREVAPSGRQGLGPQRCLCRPMCVPSSSLSPACGAGLWVGRGLCLSLHMWCACPGGRLFSAVAICLHADFCNKDYFLIGQGC